MKARAWPNGSFLLALFSQRYNLPMFTHVADRTVECRLQEGKAAEPGPQLQLRVINVLINCRRIRSTPSLFRENLGGQAFQLATGSDGAVWFTDGQMAMNGPGQVGRITTEGVVTSYPTSSGTHGITLGPDGAVWFTESVHGLIGRITASGVVTEYSAPSAGEYITTGPDGALWYSTGAGIGDVRLQGGLAHAFATRIGEPWSYFCWIGRRVLDT